MGASASYAAAFTVTLSGLTAAQFDDTAKTAFKQVVAANAGAICGETGAVQCAASDVAITSTARRATATVAFTLTSYNSATNAAVATSLQTFINSTTFPTALTAKGGALAAVSGVSVASASSSGTSTATVGPTPTQAPVSPAAASAAPSVAALFAAGLLASLTMA